MLRRPVAVALAVVVVGAPGAVAHEGNPNYLSRIDRITPATAGVSVEVLNRDDRLLLRNTSGKDVVVEGYDGEPYARVLADGTVQVNTDSEAHYLNDDRFADVDVPAGVGGRSKPQWKEIARTGRFEWHDHRAHWMAKQRPPQVDDASVQTEIFTWQVPLEIDGARGAIDGTLFWTPLPGGGPPLGAVFALAGFAIACCIAVAVIRDRRRAAGERRASGGLVIRRLWLVVALVALLPAVAAAPASAHAVLEATTPERGAALERAPRTVALRFSEAVEVQIGAVRVYDAGGKAVQRDAAFHPGGDDRAVAVALRPRLPRGGYTATYRVVSADSHPISGGFVFGVGADGAAAAVTVGELLDGEGSGPVTSVAFAAARALQFAAIALAVGAVGVLLLVWLPALAALALPGAGWGPASEAFARRWRAALLVAAGLGLASAVLALPLQAATAAGSTFWAGIGNAPDVLQTRFGTVWGLGALAWLLVLGLGAVRAGRAPAVRPATVGAAGVAVPRSGAWLAGLALPLLWLVCLPALGGHASVQEPVEVLLPANVLHVLAASAWIGGIAVLVFALPAATRRLEPADRTRLLSGAIGRFSTVALVSVATLLAGGILQSLLELSAVDDLADTAYGRAIVVKSVLVVGLLALGGLNRQRTLPALAQAAAAGAPAGRPGAVLRRALRAEVALGVAALAATGALAGYPPADSQAAGPFSASAALGPARAELTVEPALAGPNEVHLYFFDRASGRQWDETQELTARASLPDRSIELAPRKAGPGHYVIGGAPLAPAGDWTLDIVARVSEFDEVRTRFEVPVE